MKILTYDIDYNEQTGYYNIVDSEGKRYGEYLTYEDADRALDINQFNDNVDIYGDKFDETIFEPDPIEDPEQYIVCREYSSYGQDYFMFSRGGLTKHISYPQTSVRRGSFNDKSIKVYNNMEQAKAVADRFNQISMSKGRDFVRYANWRALPKWW